MLNKSMHGVNFLSLKQFFNLSLAYLEFTILTGSLIQLFRICVTDWLAGIMIKLLQVLFLPGHDIDTKVYQGHE